MSAIAICPGCGAKNRVRTDAGGRPRCGRCQADLPWLVDATDQTFERDVDVPLPVLVDLWAPWCGPCRVVAPVLEELSREKAGRLKIVKIDVDRNPRLAQRFRAQSIPMLVLWRDGQVQETVVGAPSKAALRQLVERHGA